MNARRRFGSADQYDFDREETPSHWFEKGRRRSLVSMFIRERNYWSLLTWLTSRARDRECLPRFWSLDEALAYFHPRRFENDDLRASYVVARYFRLAKWTWLDEPRFAQAAE